jgi:hypothetical protein
MKTPQRFQTPQIRTASLSAVCQWAGEGESLHLVIATADARIFAAPVVNVIKT